MLRNIGRICVFMTVAAAVACGGTSEDIDLDASADAVVTATADGSFVFVDQGASEDPGLSDGGAAIDTVKDDIQTNGDAGSSDDAPGNLGEDATAVVCEGEIDDCGVCNGNNADKDCAGVCNGDAVVDCNGNCDGGAVLDCNDVCGGEAVLDCKNVCGGDAVEDCKGVCGGDAVEDCEGVCGGNAKVDCKNVCGGTAVVDCNEVCGGGAVEDDCGRCGGNNVDKDCNGECFGGAMEDDCGTCDTNPDNNCSPIYMFSTTIPNGNLGTRANADSICASQFAASAASLTGYKSRALICMADIDEVSNFPSALGVPANTAIRSLSGTRLAKDWDALMSGLETSIYDAGVVPSGGETFQEFATGCRTPGSGCVHSCYGFTAAYPSAYACVGRSDLTNALWISSGDTTDESCSFPMTIPCIAHK